MVSVCSCEGQHGHQTRDPYRDSIAKSYGVLAALFLNSRAFRQIIWCLTTLFLKSHAFAQNVLADEPRGERRERRTRLRQRMVELTAVTLLPRLRHRCQYQVRIALKLAFIRRIVLAIGSPRIQPSGFPEDGQR